ncbi:hypothetical protein [Catenuloplanes niger]
MGIRATDETSINSIGFKQFRSSQPAEPEQQGQQPYAVVNYNSYPNALDPLKLQPGDAAETGTRTPVMKGVFSDADAGTGRVDFEVYDRTGATLLTNGSGGHGQQRQASPAGPCRRTSSTRTPRTGGGPAATNGVAGRAVVGVAVHDDLGRFAGR